jgi:hypothetical protein
MDIEVHQDLMIFDVRESPEGVCVDLYGGAHHACGSVVFKPSDGGLTRTEVDRLQRWHAAATPLTYVRRGGQVALIDDAAQFDASWTSGRDRDTAGGDSIRTA